MTANAPCPTCDGERYDITYRGAPAEDGGPDPCPTCNGSGTTERRPDPEYKVIDLMAALTESIEKTREERRRAQ